MGRISKQRAALKKKRSTDCALKGFSFDLNPAKKQICVKHFKDFIGRIPDDQIDNFIAGFEYWCEEQSQKFFIDKNKFNENTPCTHVVVYLRGENTTIFSGDSLKQAFDSIGGLEDCLEVYQDDPSSKNLFRDLFDPEVQRINFGDDDFGYAIYRGDALKRLEELNGFSI